MIRNLLIPVSFLFVSTAFSQQLISVELVDELSKDEVEAIYEIQALFDVSLYKASYRTTGIGGGPDTASGLIGIPSSLGHDQAIVAYQHGTTNGPGFVPSLLTADTDMPIGYVSMGYIVSAADYLGLGDNDGFHPYLHAETEASAGLDMLLATIEFVEELLNDDWMGQLFISGYSQGGHAAMALFRELDQNWGDILPVTAVTPMSGPYSISGVMRDKIFSDDIYIFAGYIPYVIMSYQEIYGDIYNSLDEVFKIQYVSQIEKFYSGEIDLTSLTTFLAYRLFLDYGAVRPKRMFHDEVLQQLIDDENHPFNIAMKDNDVVDWAPSSPTRLIYCTNDDQVPFQNTVVADSTMNANGSVNVTSVDILPSADHAECGPPAFFESLEFFNSFLISGIRDKTEVEIRHDLAYPNPTSNTLTIQLDTFEPGMKQVEFIDLSGHQHLAQRVFEDDIVTINISSMAPGMYVLRISSASNHYIQKLTIN
jgi:hypothetical protein